MKIYVSEKEIKSINNTFADVYEKNSNVFFKTAVPIKSLEQHDKDLLREFANSIKNWVDNNYEDYRNGGASIDQFALKTKGAIRTLLKERGVE